MEAEEDKEEAPVDQDNDVDDGSANDEAKGLRNGGEPRYPKRIRQEPQRLQYK
jgi:hypothetical protein